MDMDDLFSAMFGGGFDDFGGGMGGGFFDPSGGRGGGRRKPAKGRDTTVPYDITLEEAFKGKKVVMSIERDRVCGGCKGSGAKPGVTPKECSKCSGKGVVFTDRMVRRRFRLSAMTDRRLPVLFASCSWAQDLWVKSSHHVLNVTERVLNCGIRKSARSVKAKRL